MLESAPYRTALANQTEWSKANIARFKNMIRAVARITISCGYGRGAALGIVRIRPATDGKEVLRADLRDRLDPAELDGIISMHLIESDPSLSKPLGVGAEASLTGAGDWYVLIDGTDVPSISAAIAARFSDAASFKLAAPVSSGIYRLMWDLARSDIAVA